MRILVAEEVPTIAQSLCAILAPHHYAIDIAQDGQTAWRFIDAYDYDLLIIDEVLPRLDGISLCRRVRSHHKQMPILLVANCSDGHQRSIGLDAGADDYMVQPINGEELVARVRALLRRRHTTNAPVLSWGNLQLESSTRTVTFNRQILALTPKEYALLELLMHDSWAGRGNSFASAGGDRQRVFSYSKIIEHLWVGDESPGEEAVRTHMKGLRHKLKAAGMTTDPIETVYGIGYRLRPPLALTTPSLPQRPRSLSLLIADPDVETVTELATAALLADINIQTATDILSLRSSIALYRPQMVLLELTIAADIAAAHQLLMELQQISPPLAIVVWSQLSDLATRRMVAQSGICRFIAKPCPPQLAIDTVRAVDLLCTRAAQRQQAEGKILILHHSSPALMALYQALEPLNYRLYTLQEPQLFWSTLVTVRPELVIVALDLLDCSGLEICQMLRQDAHWYHLPIIMLADHPQVSTIQDILAAGADDFLLQPLSETTLAADKVQRLLMRRSIHTAKG